MKNSTNNIFYKYLGWWVLLILTVGIASIYLVEWMMTEKKDVISTDYLSDLSNFYAPVGIILSAATIVLLYANFKHQQLEFSKMNDMPLIIYEKKRMEVYFKSFKKRFDDTSVFDYELFMSMLNSTCRELKPEAFQVPNYNDFIISLNNLRRFDLEILESYFVYLNDTLITINKTFSNSQSVCLMLNSIDPLLVRFIRLIQSGYEHELIYDELLKSSIKDKKEVVEMKSKLEFFNKVKRDKLLQRIVNFVNT